MADDSSRYRIDRIAGQATKYLRRLPRKQQQAVAQAFEELEASPVAHPNPTTIRPMKGKMRGLWRYRVGELRILYAVDEKERTVQILAIQPRGDSYK